MIYEEYGRGWEPIRSIDDGGSRTVAPDTVQRLREMRFCPCFSGVAEVSMLAGRNELRFAPRTSARTGK